MIPPRKYADLPITDSIQGAALSFYTPDEIRKLSVKRVTSPVCFTKKQEGPRYIFEPVSDGLYDKAFGPVVGSQILPTPAFCATCDLPASHCPGHWGHIELPVPVLNPLLEKHALFLLGQFCFNCHKLRVATESLAKYQSVLQLIDQDNLTAAIKILNTIDKFSMPVARLDPTCLKFAKFPPTRGPLSLRVATHRANLHLREAVIEQMGVTAKRAAVCPNCKAPRISVRTTDSRFFVTRPSTPKTADVTYASPTMSGFSDWALNKEESDKVRLLVPYEIRGYFRILWEKMPKLMALMYSGLSMAGSNKLHRTNSYEMFFIETLPVIPPRFRPASATNDRLTVHPLTWHYQRIIKTTRMILSGSDEKNEPLSDREADVQSAQHSVHLQQCVQALYYQKGTASAHTILPKGIKGYLEKKEGLFRSNIMGKRVNYAARSVISPDPYIDTSEIGVPLVFAQRLVFPEPVTDFNISLLRSLVINGPDTYPGAHSVHLAGGELVALFNKTKEERVAIAKLLRPSNTASLHEHMSAAIKVTRHLLDGDYLLVNRQPSLHKPSMMGHRAKVLGSERTIHMHYANCNSYNADFDGDEMNLHLPQNQLTRAELMLICNNEEQYLVPKDGAPLRGLIQDHIVSGVYLTCKDSFFTKDKFQQLVFLSCVKTNTKQPFRTPVPAILKPVPLWTGKQVISTVLDHLLAGKAPLNLQSTDQIPSASWGKGQEEGVVIFRQNHLVQGKNQFGIKPGGLAHAVNGIYGSEFSGNLLTILGRLLTGYLQTRGFSCGVDGITPYELSLLR